MKMTVEANLFSKLLSSVTLSQTLVHRKELQSVLFELVFSVMKKI